MSFKSKGINAERELVHMFWAEGWACLRIAGSGSSKYPSPDLLVGNSVKRLAIECKVTREDKKYFEKKEVEALETFARIFGAEPWVAVKFGRTPWHFIPITGLFETGKSFYVDLEKAKNAGFLFEEIASK